MNVYKPSSVGKQRSYISGLYLHISSRCTGFSVGKNDHWSFDSLSLSVSFLSSLGLKIIPLLVLYQYISFLFSPQPTWVPVIASIWKLNQDGNWADSGPQKMLLLQPSHFFPLAEEPDPSPTAGGLRERDQAGSKQSHLSINTTTKHQHCEEADYYENHTYTHTNSTHSKYCGKRTNRACIKFKL